MFSIFYPHPLHYNNWILTWNSLNNKRYRREFRRSYKDVRKSPDLGIKSSHHRISVPSRCSVGSEASEPLCRQRQGENHRCGLWTLSVWPRRGLVKFLSTATSEGDIQMEKTESYGKDVEKTKQVELVRFQKKLCEVFTRPFSQMGAPFIVVHVVHPFRQVNARWWPEGQSESTKQLHVGGPQWRNLSHGIAMSCAVAWNRLNIEIWSNMKIMLWGKYPPNTQVISGYWLYAYTTHYALSMCSSNLLWIVCSCLVFPDENAGETCCLLRVDLKSLCISSCLRPTLKMLKDAEGRFWLAGHLVTHPFSWLSLTMKPFWYQEISMIYQYFNSSEVRSAKIWGPMSPSWFLDILCSFSSWCANTSTSLTSSSEVFGMLPFVTHVIHVKASKILRNFVEICQRLSPRLQIYAPYAAIPIHLQKQSRRIAHRNNRLFGRMSA